MGFFHEGHLSLMKKGRELGDDLVISIFVNPAQFGPQEDFESYPRDLERDLQLAKETGVDAVFTPDNLELYPEGFQTYIELEKLSNHLCGLSRPVFFKGVATVVAKLFNIVKPNVAIFGEKDYQQLTVILLKVLQRLLQSCLTSLNPMLQFSAKRIISSLQLFVEWCGT